MTCPECGAKTHESWPVLQLGPGWKLEVHTHHCQSCGWVTVQDWRWVDEDKQERTP